ncbi:cysteine desulfurase/selenocysteine lyase [Streptomyces sp. SAI-135]|uniref:aminotransferase class V-fold PLP-dependent enzyme n=1 Tax=unclassified Streptomyces TaxID=2593676 RepID=UPI0024741F2B|nr:MULTISPECIES: aminotransferase class V-fold PLP-dependent enzyme [unclassified Streptomyces]MDH6523316.1 cysteine desulfurase/selenocysteine lyase [Streptomyces sp. SAI-090]MDH6613071.1 cysteine desulfurase/selenocysteine lyase [Streptomyces sp. SAI-135]
MTAVITGCKIGSTGRTNIVARQQAKGMPQRASLPSPNSGKTYEAAAERAGPAACRSRPRSRRLRSTEGEHFVSVLADSGIREQFPAAENLLYLDAAHQTPLPTSVRATLDAFYDQALHTAGPKQGWLNRVEEVRDQLARFLGVDAHDIAFTKNTSEGLNVAAHGVRWEPGDNVLLLEGEHPNNAYAWLSQRPHGLEVRLVPQDKKWADADSFAPYIDERTRAIAISHVMFHSGQRNDVAAVTALARQHGIEVVVDAMQSVGVLAVDARALGVSALASGCHKGLLVPQGLGFLYTPHDAERLPPTYVALAGVANSRTSLVAGPEPVQLRPGAQRFEIGNFNLAAIHGLGASLALIESVGIDRIESHVLSLGDHLLAGLDGLDIPLVGPVEREHRSHIYVLDLPGPFWPELFTTENVRLSPVRDGIRVSFGLYNTTDDVDRFVDLLRRGRKLHGTV